MGCLLVHLACLLYAAQSACAWQLPHPQIQPITTATRQYSPTSTTTLKAGQQSQLLEFFQMKDKKDKFNSVEDFDQDLADEIKDALLSAGIDGVIGSIAEPPSNEQPNISAIASDSESTSSDETLVNSEKQIIHTPIQTKTPKIDATPPHTSLAQVMANQLNIDLSCVTPSNPDTKKITASDVEYHAWKMSQPPSTPEALARAHQLDLDLNILYDDEDREYVMQLSDVQLYEENSRSLRVVSQKRRGVPTNVNSKTSQRMKKLSALDERMEKRIEILAKKLGNVAGGIAKTVKLQTSDLALNIEKKDQPEIKSVEDFDSALAIEIQEALMSADLGNGSNGHRIESSESPVADADAKHTSDIKSVEDFDATIAIEIQEAFMPTDSSSKTTSDNIESDASGERGTIQPVSDVDAGAENELQTMHKSMTAAEIKGQLQTHGVKSCGNKSELAKRLHTLKRLQSMTKEELKQDLRDQGLKVSGKKAELVERLIHAEAIEKKADSFLFFVDMQ